MLPLVTLHLRLLGRDRAFYRALVLFGGLAAMAMVLLTQRSLQRSIYLPDAGAPLYRWLTLGVLGMLIIFQPEMRAEIPGSMEPYSRWQVLLTRLFLPAFDGILLMFACLPVYALAVYTGGVSWEIFLKAGTVLFATGLLMSALRLIGPLVHQGGAGVAQVGAVSLNLVPYFLILIPGMSPTVGQWVAPMSALHALWELFSDQAASSWWQTCTVYVLLTLVLFLGALRRAELYLAGGIDDD